MLKKALLTLALVALVGFPLPAAAAKSYYARSFDVNVEVEPNNALLVTETVVFDFQGGPFNYVFRDLTTEFSDRVEVLGAEMDGEALPQGETTGHFEVEGDDPIEVTWHFASLSDGPHTFTLRYRVYGAAFRGEDADVLRWECLPSEHEYAIQSASCRIDYPVDASLTGTEMEEGQAEVERSDSAVTFLTAGIEEDETLVVALRFAQGNLIVEPPAWQLRRQEIRERSPYFIAAAVAVLVMGLFLVIAYRLRHRHRDLPPAHYTLPQRPPRDRSAAVAGALRQHGRLDDAWSPALGTFFDLMQRGWIGVEKIEKQGWLSQEDYALHLRRPPEKLPPHKEGLLDLIFGSGEDRQVEVRLSEVRNRLSFNLSRFTEPLKEEMRAMDLFDPRYRRARKVLITVAVLLLVLSALGFLAVVIFLTSTYGPWPALIAGSLFVVGVTALILGATISPLTDEAMGEAEAWGNFRKYLRQVTRGKKLLTDPRAYEEHLPYAAAMGLASEWAKHWSEETNVAIPDWFGPLAQDSTSMAAFVVVMAAASSSSTTGGAGGASAAGGGASGAG
jgi:hypothetical protein